MLLILRKFFTQFFLATIAAADAASAPLTLVVVEFILRNERIKIFLDEIGRKCFLNTKSMFYKFN